MTEGNALEQFAGELAGGTGHWNMDTGVLVVGAGLAGHCATFEAASAGARVVLLEKRDAVGGSTVLSGGAMAFAGTDEQIAAGIADSDARLRQDLFEVGERRSDERLIDAYARHQHETFRWLKTHGVEFHSVQLGGGQSVPRSNRVDTRQMIGALGVSAADTGRVTLRTNTAALRLIRSHADKRVEGAIVDSSGEMVSIRARTGVVLASGGFSRSEDLLISFAPAQAKALRIGGPGNVGDGMRMACALGAGLKDMGYVRGTFGTHPDTAPEELAIIHAIYKGAIAVNSAGRRFIDESVSYKLIGDACLQQPSALAFQIFDQGVMELSIAGVATSDFQAQLESGRLLRGSTLEELAGKAGINAEALISTVTAYNADVEPGCDRVFGRDGLANHYGTLRKIDWPPFYAYPSTSALLATYAGLHVNDAMQVRDVFGDVINGLFAAGEVIGGFHGAAYMTGSSLGKCAVFGRIAGLNATKIGSRSN